MAAGKIRLVALGALGSLCVFSLTPALAQDVTNNKVPAILDCGALSSDHKVRPFTQRVEVVLSRNHLMVERKTGRRPGTERLEGSVDSAGTIKLSGGGEYNDHSAGWTLDLRGRLKGAGDTVLSGTLRGGYGKGRGRRNCRLTFLVPSGVLRIRLSAFFELEKRQDQLEERQTTVEEKNARSQQSSR
jgi:hypothetical protein